MAGRITIPRASSVAQRVSQSWVHLHVSPKRLRNEYFPQVDESSCCKTFWKHSVEWNRCYICKEKNLLWTLVNNNYSDKMIKRKAEWDDHLLAQIGHWLLVNVVLVLFVLLFWNEQGTWPICREPAEKPSKISWGDHAPLRVSGERVVELRLRFYQNIQSVESKNAKKMYIMYSVTLDMDKGM